MKKNIVHILALGAALALTVGAFASDYNKLINPFDGVTFPSIHSPPLAQVTPDVVPPSNVPTTNVEPGPVAAVATSFIVGIAAKYPILLTVLSVIGVLRTLVKPIMSFLHQRAGETIDTADDERLAKAESSWWFKTIAYVLDWTASVKLPVKK